jgi:hypothetical protein
VGGAVGAEGVRSAGGRVAARSRAGDCCGRNGVDDEVSSAWRRGDGGSGVDFIGNVVVLDVHFCGHVVVWTEGGRERRWQRWECLIEKFVLPCLCGFGSLSKIPF